MSLRAVMFGLVGGAAAVALTAIAERTQQGAAADANGWNRLRPSWMQHGLFVGCCGFAAAIAYFFVAGGSSLPDAGRQNAVAFLLLLGLGAAAAYTGWQAYGRTIMWKGDDIRVRPWIGRDLVRPVSDVVSVTESVAFGDYRLTFSDGSVLRFSVYAHGARDFRARLAQELQRQP